MTTSQNTINYILDQIDRAGIIRSRKMFGDYCIYCDDKVVALVCDNELFVKPTKAGEEFLGSHEKKPAYPGAKPSLYISGDKLEDKDWICHLINITASQIPISKKR